MTWTQPAYEAIARVLGARTGLTFPPDRRTGAEQGIHPASPEGPSHSTQA